MSVLKLATLTCIVALAGCAATVQKSGPAASAAAGASAPAAQPGASAVRVPAESGKRLVLNISGSKVSAEAKDWAAFKEEWRAIFQQQAGAAGVKFDYQDGPARPTGEPGTLLMVYINDYRYVGVGARMLVGIMTGNAYVDASLKFTDLNTGASFGEQAYNTSSSAWHGVFAAMTPKQIYAIADDVIRELKGP